MFDKNKEKVSPFVVSVNCYTNLSLVTPATLPATHPIGPLEGLYDEFGIECTSLAPFVDVAVAITFERESNTQTQYFLAL